MLLHRFDAWQSQKQELRCKPQNGSRPSNREATCLQYIIDNHAVVYRLRLFISCTVACRPEQPSNRASNKLTLVNKTRSKVQRRRGCSHTSRKKFRPLPLARLVLDCSAHEAGVPGPQVDQGSVWELKTSCLDIAFLREGFGTWSSSCPATRALSRTTQSWSPSSRGPERRRGPTHANWGASSASLRGSRRDLVPEITSWLRLKPVHPNLDNSIQARNAAWLPASS